MKIDALELIKNALIGGRNGENAYVYNNPLMYELFSKFKMENWDLYGNDENKAFRAFLSECLNETDKTKENPVIITTYKDLRKDIQINKYSEEYKEYDKACDKLYEAQKDKKKCLEKLAQSINPTLACLGTYDVEYKEYGTFMRYNIIVEEIMNIPEN